MNCPACHSRLFEDSTACHSCGFSLAQCDTAFGIPPRLSPPVADPGGILSRSQQKRVMASLSAFTRKFPQSKITVVLLAKPPQASARSYLFWIFNRTELHAAVEKGSNNRNILLWIDPDSSHVSVMIGYGLEPLVSDEPLQAALQAAQPLVESGQLPQAIQAFTQVLTQHFMALIEQIPLTFGLFPAEQWID